MKKIVKIVLIISMLLTTLWAVQSVYAADTESKLSIETDKTEYSVGDKVIVYAKLTNVQSDVKIISMELTLEYDKNNLELESIEGQNGWETPTKENYSYNEANGKIVITRNGLVQNDENVLKLTFKLIEKNENIGVSFKDIVTGGGDEPVKFANVSKKIAIKEEKTNNSSLNNTTTGTTTNTNKEDTNKQSINKQNTATPSVTNNKLNTSSTKLPQTGKNDVIFAILIVVFAICSVFFYIKDKKQNGK